MQQDKKQPDYILVIFVATCFLAIVNLVFTIDTQRRIKETRHDIIEYIDKYTLPLD